MKSKTLLIVPVLFMLCLSGCALMAGERRITYDIHKGYDGLKIEFLPNAPPDEIYENTEFQLGIKMMNRGAFDIRNGMAVIGPYTPFFEYEDEVIYDVDVDGKSPYNPVGSEEIRMVKAENKGIAGRKKEDTANLFITACYNYQTFANPMVCIDHDIYGTDIEAKPCVVQGEFSLPGGQGAPVAVTRIKEKIFPSGNQLWVNFEIFIANKGDGHVESIEHCSGMGLPSKNVRIEVMLSNEIINCTKSEVNLVGKGEQSVRCSAQIIEELGVYETPLSIILNYGYTTTIQKKIKVTRITPIPEIEIPWALEIPVTGFEMPCDMSAIKNILKCHTPAHDGMSFNITNKTKIKAVAGGYVRKICQGTCGGYGNYVLISHGSGIVYTRYSHLSKIEVAEEDWVEQGNVIGDSTSRLGFQVYTDSYQKRGSNPLCFIPELKFSCPEPGITECPWESKGFKEFVIKAALKAEAEKQDVNAAFVFAISHTETKGKFNHRYANGQIVKSPKGALGLMQIVAEKHPECGDVTKLDENIRCGIGFLKSLLSEFNDDYALAAAAYNAGAGAVRQYGGVPPYKETQDYVRMMKDNMARYATIT